MADTPKQPQSQVNRGETAPTGQQPQGREVTDSGSDATMEQRIRDLEAALVAQRAAMPLSLVPEHGGGEGQDIAPTWSQADQEAAQNK